MSGFPRISLTPALRCALEGSLAQENCPQSGTGGAPASGLGGSVDTGPLGFHCPEPPAPTSWASQTPGAGKVGTSLKLCLSATPGLMALLMIPGGKCPHLEALPSLGSALPPPCHTHHELSPVCSRGSTKAQSPTSALAAEGPAVPSSGRSCPRALHRSPCVSVSLGPARRRPPAPRGPSSGRACAGLSRAQRLASPRLQLCLPACRALSDCPGGRGCPSPASL